MDASGLCLTPGERTAHGGTSLVLAACSDSSTQRWKRLPDGSLENGAGGQCLDVVDGSLEAGAVVQLFSCNGTAAQQWVPNGEQEIINSASGKCLDSRSMTVMGCTGGASQRWSMPTG
ncbi:ricin-type beta-trefoil lectin domain protein [Streptomyces sp. NPDC006654]|uniref:RICIN domain-containing protein n=1 Tax=Streptomyces sp. NPDC006654 TaxID=3156897 RepID=UPI003406F473